MLSKSSCTGCTACSVVCPVHAIEMIKDEFGSSFSRIDENKCIHCGLCEIRCPVLQIERKEYVPCEVLSVNAVQVRDAALREMSSSGGLFSLLAECVLSNGGVVVGCAMKEDCYSAHHIIVEHTEELCALRGSKYVESDLGTVISQTVNMVKSGRQVLFSGAPCQVAGLISVLGNEHYDNLLTVDFICHGVPVPFAWESYIRYRETVADGKAGYVRFRSKKKGWRIFSLQIGFDNGDAYLAQVTEDAYLKGFIQNLYLRENCYSCKNKGSAYFSDITIADFWGVNGTDQPVPEFDDDKGTSLAIVHTRKAESYLDQCGERAFVRKLSAEKVLANNQSYNVPAPKNPLRKRVLKEMQRFSFDKVYDRYYGRSLISRVRRKVYMMVDDKE